jgi:hypothetical protein
MLAKILVGAIGLFVVGAGGYFYWEHQLNPDWGSRPSPQVRVEQHSCCSSRLKQISISCEQLASFEVLSVMPREVEGDDE